MAGMQVAVDETEITASQADSLDDDYADDADDDADDDDDDDDDDDKEWMNDGCDLTELNNSDVLTTRRVKCQTHSLPHHRHYVFIIYQCARPCVRVSVRLWYCLRDVYGIRICRFSPDFCQ